MKVRIFNGDDSVDIEITQENYIKLKNFINRQEIMQIFIINCK